MAYLDFGSIKEQVPFSTAVSMLGLKLKQSGHQWRGACPCGNGGDRALVITEGKGAYCFGAQKGGDVIWLTSHVKELSVKDAAAFLAHKLGGDAGEPERESTRTLKPLELEHDHAAVVALGFDAQDAQALGLGYAKTGIMRGLVAIPIRLEDGSLAGYVGLTDIAKLPPRWHLPEQKVVQLKRA